MNGNNTFSDFIKLKQTDSSEVQGNHGATSFTYKVRVNGRTYFKKQLRPELQHQKRYRELFFKEYKTAKNIKNPYLREYFDINIAGSYRYLNFFKVYKFSLWIIELD